MYGRQKHVLLKQYQPLVLLCRLMPNLREGEADVDTWNALLHSLVETVLGHVCVSVLAQFLALPNPYSPAVLLPYEEEDLASECHEKEPI